MHALPFASRPGTRLPHSPLRPACTSGLSESRGGAAVGTLVFPASYAIPTLKTLNDRPSVRAARLPLMIMGMGPGDYRIYTS